MLYVVHGWLHLAGYDDLRPQKKRLMRAAEKRAMTLLRAAGAKPVFQLRPARKPARNKDTRGKPRRIEDSGNRSRCSEKRSRLRGIGPEAK
jgi:probable rRNA maturation factor